MHLFTQGQGFWLLNWLQLLGQLSRQESPLIEGSDNGAITEEGSSSNDIPAVVLFVEPEAAAQVAWMLCGKRDGATGVWVPLESQLAVPVVARSMGAPWCWVGGCCPLPLTAEAVLRCHLFLNRYLKGERHFAGIDLSHLDLSRLNLSGSDFSQANLSGTNLQETVLERVNFQQANLSGCDLKQSNLCGSNLERANLADADLCGANLSQTRLYRTNLRSANLHWTQIRQSLLIDSDLSGLEVSGADLSQSQFYRCPMTGVNLQGAILRLAILHQCDLRGADLSRTEVIHAWVLESNLADARLTQSQVLYTCLRQVELRGADLRHALMFQTHLSQVELAGAKLKNCQLAGVLLNDTRLTWQQRLQMRWGVLPGWGMGLLAVVLIGLVVFTAGLVASGLFSSPFPTDEPTGSYAAIFVSNDCAKDGIKDRVI